MRQADRQVKKCIRRFNSIKYKQKFGLSTIKNNSSKKSKKTL